MTALSQRLGPLHEPEFRKLFLGQAISTVGTMFTIVALPFAVLSIGGSATDIGLVAAAGMVPLTLFLLVGGVWADRLPRQKVMLVADAAKAVLQAATAALLLAGVAHVWELILLQIGMGIAQAFFHPAYVGLVPQVVSEGRLQQANSLQGLVQSASITIGSMAAGLLVAAVGAGWAIAFDCLTFVVSAWFLWRLRPLGATATRLPASASTGMTPPDDGRGPSEDAAQSGSGFLRDLADGWHEFVSQTWLWVMVAGASIFLLTIDGPIQVLGPVVSLEAYDGARTWGFWAAAVGVGQIAGGLLSLRWRPRRPLLVIAAGMSFTSVPVALLAVQAPVWLLFGSLVVMGVEWGLYDVFFVTCMQREIAPDRLSRVSSYDYVGSLIFYPLGLALVGPLADAFGVETVLWGSAVAGIAVSVFQVSFRDVRASHGGPEPSSGPAVGGA